jgi:hypothetical protein
MHRGYNGWSCGVCTITCLLCHGNNQLILSGGRNHWTEWRESSANAIPYDLAWQPLICSSVHCSHKSSSCSIDASATSASAASISESQKIHIFREQYLTGQVCSFHVLTHYLRRRDSELLPDEGYGPTVKIHPSFKNCDIHWCGADVCPMKFPKMDANIFRCMKVLNNYDSLIQYNTIQYDVTTVVNFFYLYCEL